MNAPDRPSTLRKISGLPNHPSRIRDSVLVIIDAQKTYTKGVMKLEGVEEAITECQKLLQRFRALNRPVFHIRHDAGPGSPYDVSTDIGQIVEALSPIDSEKIITKNYPNAFVATQFDDLIEETRCTNLIIVGFMSHMCVDSTARGAFGLGYHSTIVASATATRSLPSPYKDKVISAEQIQLAALASLADLPSVVVANVTDVPD
jgi:nicotinamidase-related amidase